MLDVPLVELVQHVHVLLTRQNHFHSIQENWQDISLAGTGEKKFLGHAIFPMKPS